MQSASKFQHNSSQTTNYSLCWIGYGVRVHFFIADGSVNLYNCFMAVSQKIGNQSTSRPINTTLGIYPRDAQSYHKGIFSTVFISALFVITITWKQPRCSSVKEWIKKMWYIYTMEYYSVAKKMAS